MSVAATVSCVVLAGKIRRPESKSSVGAPIRSTPPSDKPWLFVALDTLTISRFVPINPVEKIGKPLLLKCCKIRSRRHGVTIFGRCWVTLLCQGLDPISFRH
ncbi:unnamed protein product [Macrosiphum euphorbiae]|uniref:Secreted protein n=1 Tax=Macrosiphum euphorbiae TaxID=13131 RepID=A0AAV0VUF3_9HEMI|nr:unnamed protein product [Macrosiphum euphorbiae]